MNPEKMLVLTDLALCSLPPLVPDDSRREVLVAVLLFVGVHVLTWDRVHAMRKHRRRGLRATSDHGNEVASQGDGFLTVRKVSW
jgi:hypothetical protein